MPARERYRVHGRVTESETGRPLPELIVRAYDRDLVADDLLGFATTDADGCYEIRFDASRFRDLFEARPDVYLRVWDRLGELLLLDTRDHARTDASRDERFDLVISGARLMPRRPA